MTVYDLSSIEHDLDNAGGAKLNIQFCTHVVIGSMVSFRQLILKEIVKHFNQLFENLIKLCKIEEWYIKFQYSETYSGSVH